MPVHHYGDDTHVRALVAAHAIGFTYGKVIRFKSNILSPGAYNNNRMLPSYPMHWEEILNQMINRAMDIRSEFDIIASVATGGIAHGIALARALNVPHVIIKKEEKTTHGLKGLIDGDAGLLMRARVLMVEDMSSTFGSTLRAMRPVEAEGGCVTHTFAISTWGFPEFSANVANHQVHVLCTGAQIVDYMTRTLEVGPTYAKLLRDWLRDPHDESWIDGVSWKRPEE